MSMYTLTLDGEQLAAVRLAIREEISARERHPKMTDADNHAALLSADDVIAAQWYRQFVAMRDKEPPK